MKEYHEHIAQSRGGAGARTQEEAGTTVEAFEAAKASQVTSALDHVIATVQELSNDGQKLRESAQAVQDAKQLT